MQLFADYFWELASFEKFASHFQFNSRQTQRELGSGWQLAGWLFLFACIRLCSVVFGASDLSTSRAAPDTDEPGYYSASRPS